MSNLEGSNSFYNFPICMVNYENNAVKVMSTSVKEFTSYVYVLKETDMDYLRTQTITILYMKILLFYG